MSFKKVLISLLFLMSFSVLADTYTAITKYSAWGGTSYIYYSPTEVCTFMQTTVNYATHFNLGTGSCIFLNASNGNVGTYSYGQQSSCPGGGSLSGSSCINAPSCTAPETRSTITGLCGCQPPKFLNPLGICGIPECLSYQVANTLTGACQIPPVCGSTEHYDNPSNTCHLSQLNCPGHSHANTANDACVPDAPMACPQGQHDDGSYTCVADDGIHCKVNQQSGSINGVKQCITAAPLDTAQSEAAKKAAAQSAIDASNADPTNTGLANQANNQSNSALVAGQYDANRQLESIANSANDAENREKLKQASVGGTYCDQPPSCTGDAIQCAALRQDFYNNCLTRDPLPKLSDTEVAGSADKIASVFTAGVPSDMGTSAVNNQGYVSTSFWNLSNSSCQTVPMHYKALNYDFDPCTKLETFRNLLGWFFYMFTAFSIAKLLGDLK